MEDGAFPSRFGKSGFVLGSDELLDNPATPKRRALVQGATAGIVLCGDAGEAECFFCERYRGRVPEVLGAEVAALPPV